MPVGSVAGRSPSKPEISDQGTSRSTPGRGPTMVKPTVVDDERLDADEGRAVGRLPGQQHVLDRSRCPSVTGIVVIEPPVAHPLGRPPITAPAPSCNCLGTWSSDPERPARLRAERDNAVTWDCPDGCAARGNCANWALGGPALDAGRGAAQRGATGVNRIRPMPS